MKALAGVKVAFPNVKLRRYPDIAHDPGAVREDAGDIPRSRIGGTGK